MTATTWPFIEVDKVGRPTIQAKDLKVLQLVREHITFGWDAEQLRRQHPQLCLAEIYAALVYYYEHRVECDAILEREEEQLEVLKKQLVNPQLQEGLRIARGEV